MKRIYRSFDIYINSIEGKRLSKRQQNGSIKEYSAFLKGVRLSNKRNKQGWHLRLKFGFD